MSSIAVLSAIGPYGGEFATFFRKTGEVLASKKHSITWFGVTDKELKVPNGFESLGFIKPNRSASYNHAKSVSRGIKKLKHEKFDYIVISDVDIAFLAKNWDDRIVKELDFFDVIGINVSQMRYKKFPALTFMAFDAKLLHELRWDLFSEKQGGILGPHIQYSADKRDAEICGVSVGTIIKKDTGWRIPYFFMEKGYDRSLVLNETQIVSENCQMPFGSRGISHCRSICKNQYQMAEYSFPNNDLFCTHLELSRKGSFSSKISKLWRQRVVMYFETLGIKW